MEEKKKKKVLDLISSFFKRSNKKQEVINSSKVEEDQWIFLLENQIDKRKASYHQSDEKRGSYEEISIFLVVLGIVLIYVNYFDVFLVIVGKEGGPIISRIINLGAAFVITVTGLIMLGDHN